MVGWTGRGADAGTTMNRTMRRNGTVDRDHAEAGAAVRRWPAGSEQRVKQSPDNSTLEWARAETARRTREEAPLPTRVTMPPLDRFSDEYAPEERLLELYPDAEPTRTGAQSQAVRGIICGGCCGWVEPPTSEEVYEAMRAERKTPRQRAAARVLTHEADFVDLMKAYTERAFTWRQLARALKDQGGQPPERAAMIRRLARQEPWRR